MTYPILYSFRRCPYAIRARLAILASGVVCELREVSLANKPQAMLTASPKATIPVMVLANGDVVDESLDIMRYVLSSFDPHQWLGPATDRAIELVTINDDIFKNHLDHYKYPDRYDSDALAHRDAGLAILMRYESILARQSFLAAPTVTLIDMAIVPFVRQYRAVNEAWFAAQAMPSLQKWLSQLQESESFEVAMSTWPVWTQGDAPTYFPTPQLTPTPTPIPTPTP